MLLRVTADELAVSRALRWSGKCGVLGYPLHEDGARWRAWCTRTLGHLGDHDLGGPLMPQHYGEWDD